jgi:hypothetical protein
MLFYAQFKQWDHPYLLPTDFVDLGFAETIEFHVQYGASASQVYLSTTLFRGILCKQVHFIIICTSVFREDR